MSYQDELTIQLVLLAGAAAYSLYRLLTKSDNGFYLLFGGAAAGAALVTLVLKLGVR